MPAIQAMRSDALALRAKEDVQEKIPSFFNSVNQSLGQAIVTGQDAAEQLLDSRFSAANGVIAQVRQKVSGQGGIAELTAGAGLKIISSALNVILMVFSKTTTTDIIQIASDIANFMIERKTLQLSWDAAAATYAQWVVQAGYAGQDGGTFFKNSAPIPALPLQTLPPTIMTASKWLRVTLPGAAPGGALDPNDSSSFNSTATTLSFLNGATFVDVGSAPPSANLKKFKFQVDADNDEADDATNPPTAAKPNTPRENRQVSVTIDAMVGSADDGAVTPIVTAPPAPLPTSTDSVAPLFRDNVTGEFYLYHTFDFQDPGGTEGSSVEPPVVQSNTINLINTIVGYSTSSPPGPAPGNQPQYADVLFTAPTITLGGPGNNSGDELRRGSVNRSPIQRAMGGRGALKYRDAFTPRFTERRHYAGSSLTGADNYNGYYAWGSVGSISKIGRTMTGP